MYINHIYCSKQEILQYASKAFTQHLTQVTFDCLGSIQLNPCSIYKVQIYPFLAYQRQQFLSSKVSY